MDAASSPNGDDVGLLSGLRRRRKRPPGFWALVCDWSVMCITRTSACTYYSLTTLLALGVLAVCVLCVWVGVTNRGPLESRCGRSAEWLKVWGIVGAMQVLLILLVSMGHRRASDCMIKGLACLYMLLFTSLAFSAIWGSVGISLFLPYIAEGTDTVVCAKEVQHLGALMTIIFACTVPSVIVTLCVGKCLDACECLDGVKRRLKDAADEDNWEEDREESGGAGAAGGDAGRYAPPGAHRRAAAARLGYDETNP